MYISLLVFYLSEYTQYKSIVRIYRKNYHLMFRLDWAHLCLKWFLKWYFKRFQLITQHHVATTTTNLYLRGLQDIISFRPIWSTCRVQARGNSKQLVISLNIHIYSMNFVLWKKVSYGLDNSWRSGGLSGIHEGIHIMTKTKYSLPYIAQALFIFLVHVV